MVQGRGGRGPNLGSDIIATRVGEVQISALILLRHEVSNLHSPVSFLDLQNGKRSKFLPPQSVMRMKWTNKRNRPAPRKHSGKAGWYRPHMSCRSVVTSASLMAFAGCHSSPRRRKTLLQGL